LVASRDLRAVAVLAVAAGGVALLFLMRSEEAGRATAPGVSSLALFDRGGRKLEVLGSSADYLVPRISPDGTRLAMDMVDSATHRRDIWLCDLEKHSWRRLTSDPSSASQPVWSPDGRRLAFSSTQKGPSNLFARAADGSGADELLYEDEKTKMATDWSPDGKHIAYMCTERESETFWDIWILDVAQRKAAPLLETRAVERAAVFSPDGSSIAYSSSESGTEEVYLRPFPGPGEARRISSGGGMFPRFRRDGKELFYVAPGNRLTSVSLPDAGTPRELFAPKMAFAQFYDVSPDAQRFVISLTR